MGRMTIDKPKAMVGLSNKPLLKYIQEALLDSKIKDITVVAGYKEEKINLDNIEKIINKDWKNTGNIYSLFLAQEKINGNLIISYGDILYEPDLINELIDCPGDIVLVADSQEVKGEKDNPFSIYVEGGAPPSFQYGMKNFTPLKKLSTFREEINSHGKWIGLIKLSPEGSIIFKNELKSFLDENGKQSMLDDFISYLINNKYEVLVQYCNGKWIDIDNEEDLSRARDIINEIQGS